jgi:DNA-binding LacI/PurR family transcriptional regulator
VGCDVEIHAGARYAMQNYRAALEKLANQARVSHWVLIGPTTRAQQWFWERKIPAFVIGTGSKQIGQPHLNFDIAALYRHAVATIVRGGHVRFAWIAPRYSAVQGEFLHDEFWNAVRHYQERPGISMQMVTHGETRESIRRAVDSLLLLAKPPTALLVVRPKHALAVLTHLIHKGVRVPQQVALLCVGHSPLIDDVTPSIAHYTTDVKSWTRKLSRVILPWVLKGEVPSADASVLPTFHEGESFAPLGTHP